MGFFSDKLVAYVEGTTVEVRAVNRVLGGLIYTLFVGGKQVAQARNFFKIPTERRLEADVDVGGGRRRFVLTVKQRILRTDYSLSVDGQAVPLER